MAQKLTMFWFNALISELLETHYRTVKNKKDRTPLEDVDDM